MTSSLPAPAVANRAAFIVAAIGIVVVHAFFGALLLARVNEQLRPKLWAGWFIPALTGVPGGSGATVVGAVAVIATVAALGLPRRGLQIAAIALLLFASCASCGVTSSMF